MRKSIQITIVAVIFATAVFFTAQLSSANGGADKSVTFSKDVAPIFFAKCASCHHEGEAAPMSLLTYKQSRPWAKAIREKVIKHEMPPWHADPITAVSSTTGG